MINKSPLWIIVVSIAALLLGYEFIVINYELVIITAAALVFWFLKKMSQESIQSAVDPKDLKEQIARRLQLNIELEEKAISTLNSFISGFAFSPALVLDKSVVENHTNQIINAENHALEEKLDTTINQIYLPIDALIAKRETEQV